MPVLALLVMQCPGPCPSRGLSLLIHKTSGLNYVVLRPPGLISPAGPKHPEQLWGASEGPHAKPASGIGRRELAGEAGLAPGQAVSANTDLGCRRDFP